MNIAHVVATFPPEIGGMGTVAFEEAKRLAAAGHQVVVFTLDHGSEPVSYQGFSVQRLRAFPQVSDAGFTPSLLWRLRGFDLVHLHYPWYGGAEWVLLANIFFKTKYILTYHMDALPLGMFKQLVQGVYDRIWAKPLLRRAKKIIAVDREHLTSATFGRFVPAEKIVSVPNGVDTAVFTPDVPRSFPASLAGWELKKIFLFVGNPLPFKRLDFILQVLSRTTDPEIVLAVVSDGYAIESYKNLARELNLLDRVRFVGRAPDAGSLNVYYTVAQSLIIASQGAAESFALVSIEALAAGCPVIASDIPGVRSRVSNGEDGMLFDPNSLEDCQRAIEKMAALSRVERDAMGGQGRLKVRREYAWEKHVERLEAVYSDVMNI